MDFLLADSSPLPSFQTMYTELSQLVEKSHPNVKHMMQVGARA